MNEIITNVPFMHTIVCDFNDDISIIFNEHMRDLSDRLSAYETELETSLTLTILDMHWWHSPCNMMLYITFVIEDAEDVV